MLFKTLPRWKKWQGFHGSIIDQYDSIFSEKSKSAQKRPVEQSIDLLSSNLFLKSWIDLMDDIPRSEQHPSEFINYFAANSDTFILIFGPKNDASILFSHFFSSWSWQMVASEMTTVFLGAILSSQGGIGSNLWVHRNNTVQEWNENQYQVTWKTPDFIGSRRGPIKSL